MRSYWPSSFFACLWNKTKSRSINTQKRTRPISSHLVLTSLVNKGFIIWLLLRLRGNFSCRTQCVIPSGQDSSILPARVANHSSGFGSSWFIFNKLCPNRKCLATKHDQTLFGDQTFSRLDTLFGDRVWLRLIKFERLQTFNQTSYNILFV